VGKKVSLSGKMEHDSFAEVDVLHTTDVLELP
jgi:hypothetical protein